MAGAVNTVIDTFLGDEEAMPEHDAAYGAVISYLKSTSFRSGRVPPAA